MDFTLIGGRAGGRMSTYRLSSPMFCAFYQQHEYRILVKDFEALLFSQMLHWLCVVCVRYVLRKVSGLRVVLFWLDNYCLLLTI